MAAGPASRLGSIEPGYKTGLRLSPHLAPSTSAMCKPPRQAPWPSPFRRVIALMEVSPRQAIEGHGAKPAGRTPNSIASPSRRPRAKASGSPSPPHARGQSASKPAMVAARRRGVLASCREGAGVMRVPRSAANWRAPRAHAWTWTWTWSYGHAHGTYIFAQSVP